MSGARYPMVCPYDGSTSVRVAYRRNKSPVYRCRQCGAIAKGKWRKRSKGAL